MNAKWNAPRTEEGLQKMLAALADARAAGDEATAGYALLELAFLVKWVRSDNDEDPFARSHTLAKEALAIFRKTGDTRGQISAILLAVPFEPPSQRDRMLADAQRLAEESGDQGDLARVIAARARQTAFADAQLARKLQREALDIFRTLNHLSGMANCLFSLAIIGEDADVKRMSGLEAARLYRELGESGEAARAVILALGNCPEPADLVQLESEAQRALAEAQTDGDRGLEGQCYGYLAEIAEANGDMDRGATYLRWKRDLAESDGLTPMERWREEIAMTKTIVALAKKSGNLETLDAMKAELKRLKAAKL